MSERDHERCHEELPGYLLGALDAARVAELERHLAGCEECRTELTWLRPAAGVLPEAVERLEPPPDLRERIMAEVRPEASSGKAKADGLRWRGIRLPRPAGRRLAAGVAVLVVLVAVVAGYSIRGDGGDGGTTVVATQDSGVTARMVSEGDVAALHLSHVDDLSRDEVLQAWVRRGERVEPVGATFEPNPDGTAVATIDDMRNVEAVMVTAEPRGGSEFPTSDPLVSVQVPG